MGTVDGQGPEVGFTPIVVVRSAAELSATAILFDASHAAGLSTSNGTYRVL
jgi:hypothetical protein